MSLAAILGGLALALAFPRASIGPLAWMAPVPWLALLVSATPGRGFRSGYLFGLAFFGLLLNWVHDVLTYYTSLPLFLTLPIWILLVGYLALYPALFGAAVAALSRRLGLGALALAPLLWVGIESARGWLLSGFPWGAAGYARAGGLPLLQAASVGGISLVSLLLAAAWSALAVWALALPGAVWQRRLRVPWRSHRPAGGQRSTVRSGNGELPREEKGAAHRNEPRTSTDALDPTSGHNVQVAAHHRPGRFALVMATAVLGLVAAVPVAGAMRLRAHPPEGRAWPIPLQESDVVLADGDALRSAKMDGSLSEPAAPPAPGTFRLALVQGGYGGDLDYEQAKAALAAYLDLSRLAARDRPALIVWPESNAPFQPLESPGYLDLLRGLSRTAEATLLLGAVAGTDRDGLTNSAFLIEPDGPPRRYDKRKLVPYGEFVPFQGLFPFIRHFVAEAGEFRAGRDVGVFPVAGRAIGVSICYEMIFPGEILAQARAGATIAINLTNDSWYRRGGPWQHADFSIVRAIETGLDTARVASTGRTLLIDRFGRTLGQGPLGGRAVLVGDLPARAGAPGGTVFVRLGDWVGAGCGILTAAAFAFLGVGNIIDRRKSRGPEGRRTDGQKER